MKKEKEMFGKKDSSKEEKGESKAIEKKEMAGAKKKSKKMTSIEAVKAYSKKKYGK